MGQVERQRNYRQRVAGKLDHYAKLTTGMDALRELFKDRTGPIGVEANRIIAEAFDGQPGNDSKS